ncbi:putative Ig domain-containing protein [Amycolatopsis nalaikhensis]|uniref:Ig domain-containing protein n=1 Tax=Amycolatopsis nalaikhensis TaxID=715472 RepID=A0ABY8XUB8_9PSEU|nr:putative Ig domain-containing protein [Amycolatopsis sp. 2-2]WIV59256.1 putative Ig domain-containing protein [Amycolatopsis sp. 2-2]
MCPHSPDSSGQRFRSASPDRRLLPGVPMQRGKLVRIAAVLAAGLACLSFTAPIGSASGDSEQTDGVEHEVLIPQPAATAASCGVERWSVKTGTDADAAKITLQSTTPTTIAALTGLAKPSTLPANNRIQPTETTVYRLQATLTKYKLESDSDYHLVLADGSGHTMIVEVPDPACVGSSSALLTSIQKARAEVNAKYTPTGSFQTANVPVTVTGVGFFDFLHGQTGVAPNGIELHAVLDIQFGSGGGSVSVSNPGNQTGTAGQPAGLQISATDTAGGSLAYTATGLPAGLSINTATGLISGTPTTAGTSSVTVTATDSTGPSGSTTFSWTIAPASGGCTAQQLLGDPGFETGTATPWSTSSGVISNSSSEPPRTGSYDAWLGGYGATHTDTLAQQVTLPTGCAAYSLGYWLHIDTAEPTTGAYDTFTVQILTSSGTVLATPATYSNTDATTGYTQHTINLSAFSGQTITVKFTGTEDYTKQTSFVLDDTTLTIN